MIDVWFVLLLLVIVLLFALLFGLCCRRLFALSC